MNKSTKDGVEKSLLQTIRESPALDTAADLLEVALDSEIAEGTLREVPVLGSLVGMWRVGAQVRDGIFVKKVSRFLRELDSIPSAERERFFSKLDQDPEQKAQLAETLLIQLERLDDMEKVELLARCFKRYAKEIISLDEFKELAAIVDRLFLSDLKQLLQESRPHSYPPAMATRLTACGVLELYSIPQIKAPEAQNQYVKTDVGKLLLHIFYEHISEE